MENWPTLETTCEVCGDPIIYFQYKDEAQTEQRRKPKAHNGQCAVIYRRVKALKKHESNQKKRGKK